MKKIVKFGLVPLLIIVIGVVVYNYPRLDIITGFSAKSVCSCTFEADRDLASIEAGDNDINPIYYAKNVINTAEKSVTSTVFGLKARKAIYKEGLGCVLLPKEIENIKFKPNRTFLKNELQFIDGAETFLNNLIKKNKEICIVTHSSAERVEIVKTKLPFLNKN